MAANSCWNIVNFRGNIVDALRERGWQIVVLAPRDAHSDRLSAMGVRHHPVEFRSSALSPLGDALLFLRYAVAMRRIKPALFLGFTIKPNVYGSLAARMLGVPTVNNVSGLGTAFIRAGLLTRLATVLYRQALRRSATVFFQNEEDRRQFVASDIVTPAQARLLPGSGVDSGHFAASPLPESEAFCFLLVARLLFDKGVQEFVDAAAIIRRRHPRATFQILGPTRVDNRTAVPLAMLDQWVSAGLIDHLGESVDVRPAIAAADCVVLPSYREGLPRSLLEASAMARPVIGSDVTGVRDVIDDGVTGMLCTVHSADSLAATMLAMIALPIEARRAMGFAGRAKVKREFALDEVTRRYIEAIEQAL